MIGIRQANLEDEARVMELLKLLLSPSGEYSTLDWPVVTALFRKMVQNDGIGTVLLAEEDGDGVGVITLSYPVAIRCAGRYACIEEFIVSERVRGRGVGSQLLEAAIAEATSRGCDEIQCNGPSELGYPVYVRQGLKDIGKHLKLKL
jgi:GNAT superfamily N-acetyltransferase